jgi:proline racemase
MQAQSDHVRLGLFFNIFPSLILQKYMDRKKMQNYTSSAVGDDGRDLPPCPTALGARVASATAAGHSSMGVVYFQKILIFLFELHIF